MDTHRKAVRADFLCVSALAARSLAAKKSGFITIIVPDISNPFFSEMVKGTEDFARENGYNIFLGDTEGKVELEKEHIDAAINRRFRSILRSSFIRRL